MAREQPFIFGDVVLLHGLVGKKAADLNGATAVVQSVVKFPDDPERRRYAVQVSRQPGRSVSVQEKNMRLVGTMEPGADAILAATVDGSVDHGTIGADKLDSAFAVVRTNTRETGVHRFFSPVSTPRAERVFEGDDGFQRNKTTLLSRGEEAVLPPFSHAIGNPSSAASSTAAPSSAVPSSSSSVKGRAPSSAPARPAIGSTSPVGASSSLRRPAPSRATPASPLPQLSTSPLVVVPKLATRPPFVPKLSIPGTATPPASAPPACSKGGAGAGGVVVPSVVLDVEPACSSSSPDAATGSSARPSGSKQKKSIAANSLVVAEVTPSASPKPTRPRPRESSSSSSTGTPRPPPRTKPLQVRVEVGRFVEAEEIVFNDDSLGWLANVLPWGAFRFRVHAEYTFNVDPAAATVEYVTSLVETAVVEEEVRVRSLVEDVLAAEADAADSAEKSTSPLPLGCHRRSPTVLESLLGFPLAQRLRKSWGKAEVKVRRKGERFVADAISTWSRDPGLLVFGPGNEVAEPDRGEFLVEHPACPEDTPREANFYSLTRVGGSVRLFGGGGPRRRFPGCRRRSEGPDALVVYGYHDLFRESCADFFLTLPSLPRSTLDLVNKEDDDKLVVQRFGSLLRWEQQAVEGGCSQHPESTLSGGEGRTTVGRVGGNGRGSNSGGGADDVGGNGRGGSSGGADLDSSSKSGIPVLRLRAARTKTSGMYDWTEVPPLHVQIDTQTRKVRVVMG